MKRTAAILLLLLATQLALGQTKLYRQYEHRREVKQVLCRMNYPVQGIKVDITLIQMVDDRAFVKVCREFGISIDPSSATQDGVIYTQLHSNDDPHRPAPLKEGQPNLKKSCLVGVSLQQRTIYIFHHIGSQARLDAINTYIQQQAK